MKEYFIGVRLSNADYEKLMRMCKKSNCNVSIIIRNLINHAEIRELPSRDYRTLSRAIDRIGNNYNQLAHKANASGVVSNADLTESRLLLQEIRSEIRSWKEQWL